MHIHDPTQPYGHIPKIIKSYKPQQSILHKKIMTGLKHITSHKPLRLITNMYTIQKYKIITI
jgi:hypothetical protein